MDNFGSNGVVSDYSRLFDVEGLDEQIFRTESGMVLEVSHLLGNVRILFFWTHDIVIEIKESDQILFVVLAVCR